MKARVDLSRNLPCSRSWKEERSVAGCGNVAVRFYEGKKKVDNAPGCGVLAGTALLETTGYQSYGLNLQPSTSRVSLVNARRAGGIRLKHTTVQRREVFLEKNEAHGTRQIYTNDRL